MNSLITFDLTKDDPAFIRDAVRHTPQGMMLEGVAGGFESDGCVTCGPVQLDAPAREMVLTWNAAAPEGTSLLIEFRVRADGFKHSVWYQMGAWPPCRRLKMWRDDPDYGPLVVDHYKPVRAFDEVEARVSLRSVSGVRSPILRRVSLCLTFDPVGQSAESGAAASVGREPVDIPVPWLSQRDPATVTDPAMISAGVCGATSVTMVLRHHGIEAQVADVARRAFDPNAGIYGNWAFLIAAASEFGLSAWVERFDSLDEIERLLAKGVPVIVSIRYGKGDLSAKPDCESRGHLVVVRGVDANGDIVCNDPDFNRSEQGCGIVFNRSEFANALFSHGGVGLVIKGS